MEKKKIDFSKRLQIKEVVDKLLNEEKSSTVQLVNALSIDDFEGARAAIEAGADVNFQDEYDTILSSSIFHGDLAIARDLIKAGADVHAMNGRALWRAAQQGQMEAVKFLLAAGAKPDSQDLEVAEKYRNYAVVKFFTAMGVEPAEEEDAATKVVKVVKAAKSAVEEIVTSVIADVGGTEEEVRSILKDLVKGLEVDEAGMQYLGKTRKKGDIVDSTIAVTDLVLDFYWEESNHSIRSMEAFVEALKEII